MIYFLVAAEDVGLTVTDLDHVHAHTRYTTCIGQDLGGSGNPSIATGKGGKMTWIVESRQIYVGSLAEGWFQQYMHDTIFDELCEVWMNIYFSWKNSKWKGLKTFGLGNDIDDLVMPSNVIDLSQYWFR